ncbi:MAG: 2'-5' RNA ligase family protein [Promethearchaeota archaeon]|jgi:2'-5' RNA ligase
MSKVFSTAVVIIPPNEIWGAIQEIRRKHDRAFDRWMPHITLLYPFKPESEFNSLEVFFSTTCRKIDSFEVKLNTFKYFRHSKQNYTIYLNPEPESLIRALQLKIMKIVPDCNDASLYKTGFMPHLSVGQIKGKDNLDIILNNLQNDWQSLTFKLNSIFFIAREKTKLSNFEIKKQILLK